MGLILLRRPNARSFWPLRSLDWRLRLARGRETRIRDLPEDGYVRAARAFIRKGRELPIDRRYRRYFPVLCRMFNLGFDEPLVAAELEAQIIAGRSSSEIAQRMRLPLDLVVAFERLLFDVRDRSRPYIQQQLIRPLDPVTAYDIGRIWTYFAFIGGPVTLDAVLDDFRLAGRPDYSHYLKEPPEPNRTDDRALVQLAILQCFVRPRDAREHVKLIEILAKRRPLSEPVDPRRVAAEAFESLASAALAKTLPESVDGAGQPTELNRPAAALSSSPAWALTG